MATAFQERVYALVRCVPAGKVTTYGALAKALNSSARAVGGALRQNPYAPMVPCHRVVKSDGALGGFFGKTIGPYMREKARLLTSEGVSIIDGTVSDIDSRRVRVIRHRG